jgi:glucose/mannose-6-phosphate isomerase
MMEKLIQAFPENISEALNIASTVALSTPEHPIRNVVICGMGGSGIGGRLVSKWVEDELSVPVTVVSDYVLPEFVSKNSLVIGSSYSGNTEETLQAIEEAIEAGAHVVGICSGGGLELMCREHDFDVVVVPGGNPPRTALAYSLVQLLNIFAGLGLIDLERVKEMESARQLIVEEEEHIKGIAHELALFLKDKVAILYGSTRYEPMLVRARQQFNENSKLLCWHHAIPEMNHNELVGWGGGDERFATVFFWADDILPRNVRRMEITRTVAMEKCGKVFDIRAKGNTLIERSIYLINVVDWASLYLAELKGVDAIDIAIIDYLKNELAHFE